MPLMNIAFPSILVKALKYLEFANIDISMPWDSVIFKIVDKEDIIDRAVAQSYFDYGYPSSIFLFSY